MPLQPKTTLTFLLLLGTTACAAMGSLAQKVGFSYPTVEVTGVQVQSVGLGGFELDFYFQANNPNPIGLEIENLSYEVSFDGNLIGTGVNARPIALPSRGASSFSVSYALAATEVLSAGLSALSGEQHEVGIKATIGVSTPFGVLTESHSHTETLSF